MNRTRTKMNRSKIKQKICILDYGKDPTAWEKGKMVYEHIQTIEKKNPQLFQSMIRNPNDYEWFEMAKKTKGNWPHPHDSVNRLAVVTRFNDPQEFIWLPLLNLFIFTVKNEKEESLIKEILPEVEIYTISEEQR